MKNKKLVYIILAIVLSLVTITVTGFVLAGVSNNRSYEELNRTAVVLEPKKDAAGNYTGKVEVLLQMNDGIKTEEQKPNEEGTIIEDAASVQSFQIGLDVSATIENKENISFEFNSNLKENAKNNIAGEVKLARVTQELEKDEQASSEEKEIYKGEKLNIYYVGTKDLNDTNSREMVSIGTLTINVPESNNETVLVNPIKEATTASSTGHTETPIDVHPEEDGVTFVMNKKDSEHEDDSGNTTGNNTTGGNTTEGNTTGDNTTDGNTTGNSTTGGNTSGDNTTGEGTTGGSTGNGGSTSGSQNNGWSAKDDEKANGNIINKIINGIKTGANHSLTWAIIAVIALIILAIVLVKIKKNTPKGKPKH